MIISKESLKFTEEVSAFLDQLDLFQDGLGLMTQRIVLTESGNSFYRVSGTRNIISGKGLITTIGISCYILETYEQTKYHVSIIPLNDYYLLPFDSFFQEMNFARNFHDANYERMLIELERVFLSSKCFKNSLQESFLFETNMWVKNILNLCLNEKFDCNKMNDIPNLTWGEIAQNLSEICNTPLHKVVSEHKPLGGDNEHFHSTVFDTHQMNLKTNIFIPINNSELFNLTISTSHDLQNWRFSFSHFSSTLSPEIVNLNHRITFSQQSHEKFLLLNNFQICLESFKVFLDNMISEWYAPLVELNERIKRLA
jgi:hypothetical protein